MKQDLMTELGVTEIELNDEGRIISMKGRCKAKHFKNK